MRNHTKLLSTTPGQRLPIKRALRLVLDDLEDDRLAAVVLDLINQIKAGCRHGTLGWICEIVMDGAGEAVASGNRDLADKLYFAANEIYCAMTALSASNEHTRE